MFEIGISDDESDSKHTQEAQNESVVTDPKIQNNQDPMEEQDEIEHTSAIPLFEETVDSRHEDTAEKHIKEEFVKEELQLNQEVPEEDYIEELKDHTMKLKPKAMIEFTLFDGQRGQATVLSSQKQPRKKNQYINWIKVRRVDRDDDDIIN